MYLFVMLLGLASIVYGLYLEAQEEEAGLKDFSDVERLYILEERLGLMEDYLDISHSDYLLDQIEKSREEVGNPRDIDYNIEEEKSFSEKKEEIEKESLLVEKLENIGTIDDKHRLYLEYKDRGHSLEEICKLLNMTKGEVILLENLNKDYQK